MMLDGEMILRGEFGHAFHSLRQTRCPTTVRCGNGATVTPSTGTGWTHRCRHITADSRTVGLQTLRPGFE